RGSRRWSPARRPGRTTGRASNTPDWYGQASSAACSRRSSRCSASPRWLEPTTISGRRSRRRGGTCTPSTRRSACSTPDGATTWSRISAASSTPTGATPTTGGSSGRADEPSELVGQTQRRLRAVGVETAQAPGLEDRRAVPAWLDEVALREVHDEVVAHHVVHRPERLHVPLVHRVDGHAERRHDAAATVERERRQGEERLPAADLVAEGDAGAADARWQV